MVTVGDNLRRVRERADLSQTDLAARMQSRPNWISLLERSTDLPSPDTVSRLAAALGVLPAELLAGVLTPWDVLRGATEPTAPKTADTRDGRETAQLLAGWAHLDEGARKLVLTMVRRLRRS
jgi:transcriptional regulator with XRE-family HTH domain